MRRTKFYGTLRSRPSDSQQKNRTSQIVDSTVLANHWIKLKESEKRNKLLDLVQELKKSEKHEFDGDANCDWGTWHSRKRIGTGTGKLGNKKTSGDHANIA